MKVFLDNNLSPAIARGLGELAKHESWSVHHLRDFFPPSVGETDWIKELGADKGWTVLSADIRLLRRPHERAALRAGKVTVFALQPGWLDLGFWDQAWLLTRWLPTLATAAAAHPPGTFFRVPAKQRPGALVPET